MAFDTPFPQKPRSGDSPNMPLDPEAQVVLDALGAATSVDPFDLSVEQWREAFSSFAGDAVGPDVARVQMMEVPGPAGPIPVRVYTPSNDSAVDSSTSADETQTTASDGSHAKPCLVYFHGGGFVLCGLDSHDLTCRELAVGAGCIVVSVDYRLAPEAKFPAAPEDCYAATCWVRDQAPQLGVDPARIAVAGDSAGGNLAAVVSILCRDRKGPSLVHQLLIYPVTEHRFDTDSYRTNGEGYFLSRAMMQWFWHQYLDSEADGRNPLASPLLAKDLSGLPPATILTAEFDPLRDEGRSYAEALERAGVSTQYTNYPGVFHGFIGMSAQIPRALLAVQESCAALRAAYGL
jgi:acetyl esterase